MQRDARLEVLASSDSALLDALPLSGASGRRSSSPLRTGGNPWIPGSLALDSLPEDLASLAETLVPGEWSATLRIGFGFVRARLAKTGRTAGMSFEAALPILAALRSECGAVEMPESGLRGRYAEEKARGLDTLILEIRLRPRSRSFGGVPAAPHPFIAADHRLPEEIRDRLIRAKGLGPGDQLGSLTTALGIWSLSVRELRAGPAFPAFPAWADRLRKEMEKERGRASLATARAGSDSKRTRLEQSISFQWAADAFMPPEAILDSLVAVEQSQSAATGGEEEPTAEPQVPVDRESERELVRARLSQAAFFQSRTEWFRKNVRVGEAFP